ncbi:Asp23/Gls24 family envelope stress response protein [Saccharibacillus deserti]|uniref:Asp23/Gls24 family envelope stress response protein n=1 Tax=Saccharibacillus deserti TaxID=1634444 RepID=UPI001557A420|nr:Asp23/Gls24 family envelope stress response protein [Saccharibacillus deserti]
MKIETGYGSIRVAEKALQKIVAGALAQTEGIVLKEEEAAGTPERLRAAAKSGRIALHIRETTLDVELRVDMRFGVRIPEVCRHLKQNVRTGIETLAGFTVGTVTIIVESLIGKRVDRGGEALTIQ